VNSPVVPMPGVTSAQTLDNLVMTIRVSKRLLCDLDAYFADGTWILHNWRVTSVSVIRLVWEWQFAVFDSN